MVWAIAADCSECSSVVVQRRNVYSWISNKEEWTDHCNEARLRTRRRNDRERNRRKDANVRRKQEKKEQQERDREAKG